MGTKRQLSAGEHFDSQNGQPLGEGLIMLRTSAGNRRCFRSPAEAWVALNANRAQFPNGGRFNDQSQRPTQS